MVTIENMAETLETLKTDVDKFNRKFPTPDITLTMFSILYSRAIGNTKAGTQHDHPAARLVKKRLQALSLDEQKGLALLHKNYKTPEMHALNHLVVEQLEKLEANTDDLASNQRALMDSLIGLELGGEQIPTSARYAMELCTVLYVGASEEVEDMIWELTS